MRYFVTGGTGLIGRHLVSRLLERGTVELLVRNPERHAARLESWASRGDLVVHEGDITTPGLGIDKKLDVDHVFHLAALYDLTASDQELERINVGGTKNLLDRLRSDRFDGTLHHVSSIAVAGDFDGTFREEQLEAGQSHPHSYHRTKYESERLARAFGPKTRVYRPSAVVGHATTGEMDRLDGPYFLFEAIDRLRRVLPPWAPMVSMAGATVDMVPVDWVASALDTIAHTPGQDRKVFHLTDPNAPTFAETWNLVAEAACAPKMSTKKSLLSRVAPGLADGAGQLGSAQFLKSRMMADLGLPLDVQKAINRTVRFDASNTTALVGAPPPQARYVPALWDYYVRNLASSADPASLRGRTFAKKIALVTGASSGVGEALTYELADAGAEVVAVARREDELVRVCDEVRRRGGRATFVVADLSDMASCDDVVTEVLARHGRVDFLFNNAGRSIRRPLTESLDRFHDLERVMQINFYAPARLIRGFLPSMVERKSGCVVNILSAGAHMPSPRFGAYTASKAALSQLGDTLAAEHAADGIQVTQAYLHWVRTPMMDATGAFEDTRAATPESAALEVLDGVARGETKLMRGTDKRRFVLNHLAPRTLSRLVNLTYRIYDDDPDRHPELAFDRTLMKKLIKGRPM